MALQQSLTNATTISNGTVLEPNPRNRDHPKQLVQVKITGGTATVSIKVSVNGTDFIEVNSVTASGVLVIDMYPFVRIDVTAVAGATVNAWVDN